MISPGRSARVLVTALFAVAVVGCSGSSTPKLTDPSEIVTRSATGIAAVKTVHFEAAVNGTIKMSGLGSAGSGLGLSGSIKLDGTTATGDVDIQKQAVHITAAVPALFGFSAEIIQVDGFQYMKSSLGGDKFSKSKATDLGAIAPSAAPSASLDISGAVASFKAELDKAGAKSTLVGTEKVDGKDAYHVSITVPKDYLNQQISAMGGSAASGLSISSITIDYWVYVDSLYPAKLAATLGSDTIGTLTVTVTLTKYNDSVTIQAPPADQVSASS